ncbi:MAG: Hpt domain-containing protein [Pseudomonadota bacterium]
MLHSAATPAQISTTDHDAIDMEHLLHYTMGDEALAREVLGLFCAQGRIYLEQLSAANDPSERKATAHTLKGSARGVGAHRVAVLAQDLEALAATPDEPAWAHALNAVKMAFEEAAGSVAEMD